MGPESGSAWTAACYRKYTETIPKLHRNHTVSGPFDALPRHTSAARYPAEASDVPAPHPAGRRLGGWRQPIVQTHLPDIGRPEE